MDIKVTITIDDDEVEKIKNLIKSKETSVKIQAARSDYARCFDESCANWTHDAEHNLMFLRLQQQYANDLLKTRGYLFLNDVYDLVGIPRTKAGQVVGWVYDENNPNGDNFVDFGIFDVNDEKKRAFVNGYERCVWLDFNVDGNILDRITE